MKKIIILLSILILAFTLRFYKLGVYPALNADEAAIGYNAYSLIQTGKDEHGNPWPIHFQSFNDYKPGLYFYVVLPFVKVFGLNIWSVRVPGAFLGVLTVLIIYLLLKEIFSDKDLEVEKETFALTASLFLAISPWHIHFSRGGWEVNTATFFIALGLWLFVLSLRKSKVIFLSALSFILSLYAYHAAIVVVPFLLIGIIIFYWKDLKKNIKCVLLSGLMALILLAPLGKDFVRTGAFSRAAGIGIFADIGPINRINEQRGEHTDFNGIFAKVLHNKAINYILDFSGNWFKHFWGEFLFLSGDVIQRNRVPETGQMYMFDFVFILVAIYAIIKKPKNWGIILYWLVIAPFAAALTFQSPHALRAQNMVIPLTIISAYGFTVILFWIKKVSLAKKWFSGSYLILFSLIALQFARYLHMYWVHMAKEYPYSSQYGVKEMVEYVLENQDKYKKVFITDKYDQPYILYLFYSKYSPQKFQRNHTLTSRDKFGFSTVRDFDKFHFEGIDFSKIKSGNPESLIIGTKEEIPDDEEVIKTIYFPNGEIAFKIVAN